jgi:hypothetical protein
MREKQASMSPSSGSGAEFVKSESYFLYVTKRRQRR